MQDILRISGTEKAPEKPVTINRYGRGNNIDVTYRIAPRLTYKVHKFLVMAEVSYNATAYGTIRDDGTVTDTEEASGIRTHIAPQIQLLIAAGA
ncbi:MAG: hypothetical protein U5L09_12355 [Bacteroidales bacterium]|nr:hypothetical protein [Bacteroidales bacterium]